MDDLKSLLKTTPKYINILSQNGISTLKELFLYFPRTYEDRKEIKTLSTISTDGTLQTVKGFVTKKSVFTTPRGKRISQIHFIDEEETPGVINVFRGTFILRTVKTEKRYYIIWKPELQYGKIQFTHPDLMEATETGEDAYNFWRIYPIYSELLWIKPARFARKIYPLLSYIPQVFTEYLPETFLKKYKLSSLSQTITDAHFPETLEAAHHSKERIFFEKLLGIQLVSLEQQLTYKKETEKKEDINRDHIKEFLSKLPFELTWAQKRCIKESIDDIYSWSTMMRLLQGDVWSGKTVVAAAIAYHIIKEMKGQVAFLAPLSVLAYQHFHGLAKLLLPLWVRIELLTGALKASQKTSIKASLHAGNIDIVVWTHAIIQEDIQFHDLQFAIVDEQHKFGVRQRGFFQRFWSPHLLQMTATPIPRSLTLAFFWEFEVSIIDEMPAGRKEITTKIVNQTELKKLKARILTKLSQKQKCFIVTPLIHDSEHEWLEEIASAHTERENIVALYPELQGKIWLLHGQMKAQEKDTIMNEFKNGTYQILVSTTVIEVWVDIPDATIMIIKNSERFWLSQLHQLRWRVWRSDLQSYCFLHTKRKSGDSYIRLKHMEDTNDGFKLAEIDLRLRWAGEILWTRQSWETDIPLEILTDSTYLHTIQEAANDLIHNYPQAKEKLLKEGGLSDAWKNLV